ncbi:Protein ApaG [Andreprevotia sp. IGB-42]|uniref:Co2+/Mg2+ efflux protein ApaG n=1 Tax=Andreprevotia sp. IGB-42 TaxID=2497473 RepID=UPI00135AFC67|nr:Co2+/Mg2+ efflux protein ApaG [Andreprevotia sp. IGB-42]KAF0813268.1 Protein ApaG [Andreprevotia sp. IGB-42]
MSNPDRYVIKVVAESFFLPEQSDEDEDRYVFAYQITIINQGEVAAQLISRHWIITDMDNKVEEVRGKGVIGEQPVLEPGQSFEYMSGATLETPVGTMRGSYRMRTAEGYEFDADIPEFVLSIPRILH